MRKFMKMTLGAVIMAGATAMGAGALSTPAQAGVTLSFGVGAPGYYGYYGNNGYYGNYGYYGPRYPGCWYGCAPRLYRPYYYGAYYGPNVWYRSGWGHRYDRRGDWGRHWHRR